MRKVILLIVAVLIGTAFVFAQGDAPDCSICVQACDRTCSTGGCGIPDGNWVSTTAFTVPCDGNYWVIATSDCGGECDCWNYVACAALMQEGISTPICSPHTTNCAIGHQCTANASIPLTAGVNYMLCAGRFPCVDGGFSCASCDISPNPCAVRAQLKRNLSDPCNVTQCP